MKITAEHHARIHGQSEEKIPELEDKKCGVDDSGVLLITKKS